MDYKSAFLELIISYTFAALTCWSANYLIKREIMYFELFNGLTSLLLRFVGITFILGAVLPNHVFENLRVFVNVLPYLVIIINAIIYLKYSNKKHKDNVILIVYSIVLSLVLLITYSNNEIIRRMGYVTALVLSAVFIGRKRLGV